MVVAGIVGHIYFPGVAGWLVGKSIFTTSAAAVPIAKAAALPIAKAAVVPIAKVAVVPLTKAVITYTIYQPGWAGGLTPLLSPLLVSATAQLNKMGYYYILFKAWESNVVYPRFELWV